MRHSLQLTARAGGTNRPENPEELVRKRRGVERGVLAQAGRWHLQDRVFLNGNKTAVFRN